MSEILTLDDYLQTKGYARERILEGGSFQIPEQIKILQHIVSAPEIQTSMEIGFNAGHSAETFLLSNPTAHLYSFDLGAHPYVSVAKEYIDTRFPGRHTLILGDSLITVPKFSEENPDIKFDSIFIDGGHSHEVAKGDIMNCKAFAKEDTVIMIDDIQMTPRYEAEWTEGPTKVLLDFVHAGFFHIVSYNSFCFGRGMAIGKYLPMG